MKTRLLLFVSMSIIFISCSKSSTKSSGEAVTNATLSGYWPGTFSAGNEGQLFRSDGSTIQYDFYGTSTTDTSMVPYKGHGNFTIMGNSVTFNLTYPTVGGETFIEHAFVNTSVTPNTITGTYSGSQAGSFMLIKQ